MKMILVLLFLVSCSTTTIKKPETTVPAPTVETHVEAPKPTTPAPSTVESGTVIPGSASDYQQAPADSETAVGKFTTNIETLNYNSDQQAKVNEAGGYIKIIMNSEEYKQEVLNFKDHNGKKQFVDNNGMTNEQIYNHLKGGAEALNPVRNYQMDVKLKMYYSNNSTVGYTYKNVLIIYTNSKFHNKYTACQVASNTTHEWTHKMGFPHDSKWSKPRDYSVPYGHNTIIEKLCPLAKAGKLTPLKPELVPAAPVPLH